MSSAERAARDEWLANLKPGDKVAASERGGMYGPRYYTGEVTRSMKTQVECHFAGRPWKFRRDGGRLVGGTWSSKTLEPVTPELLERMRTRDNRERFSSLTYKPDQLTDAQIAAMLAGYDSVPANQERPA